MSREGTKIIPIINMKQYTHCIMKLAEGTTAIDVSPDCLLIYVDLSEETIDSMANDAAYKARPCEYDDYLDGYKQAIKDLLNPIQP
jgi:hypothetical protein